MVFRKCPNCDYITNRKSNYNKHINKKFDCSQNVKNEKNIIIQNFPSHFHNISIQNKNQNQNQNDDNKNDDKNDDNYVCCFCSKSYSNKGNLTKHFKKCIFKIEKENEKKNEIEKIKIKFDELKKQNKLLQNKIDKIDNYVCKTNELNKSIKKLETSIPANTNVIIANQLIDKIIEKDKKMEEMEEIIVSYKPKKYNKLLDNDYTDIIEIEDDDPNNKQIIEIKQVEEKPKTLILNNNVIEFRKSDSYVNATQLCNARKKLFADWMRLKSTKEYLVSIESNMGIPILDLIDKNIGGDHIGTWVHPKVAINLAQWLSPEFAVQVSNWIYDLMTKGKVEVNIKLLKEKDNKIREQDKRIKLLENQLLKKQTRNKYDNSKNVVYIITNEYTKSKRTYTIGKTIDLVKRLGSYNKLQDHEVIYYKSFETEEDMEVA
jgi:hypothetical protein